MDEARKANIGDVVVWHDSKGVAHNALVTCVWTPTCINLVVISSDGSKEDCYGRQIERHTSQSHASVNNVHGYYWRFVDEAPNPYVAPVAV